MKPKILVIAVMTIISLLPFAGCEQLPPTAPTPNTPAAGINRQTPSKSPTAVESAIAISDKYAKLSEEAAALRQRKDALETENKKLAEDLQACRDKLEKAQKELAEVNDLLVQMRLELNNWKTDVLGFRDEMREAERAQIEALLKILKLLGGEASSPAEPNQTTGAPTTEGQK